MRIELRAVAMAKQYYADEGYTVSDVSRHRGHNGYDLIVSRDTQELKVEVKGCSREWQIPDLFATEFDTNRVLVADVLCVVYIVPRHRPRVCLIPREAILPEYVVPKMGYRISSRFKKKVVLAQYVDRSWPGRRWPEIRRIVGSALSGSDKG